MTKKEFQQNIEIRRTLHIEELKEKVSQLEADKLEMAKAIVDNSYSRTRSGDFICTQCDRTAYLLKKIKHDDNCIVNKANLFLGERSERD